MIIGTLLIECFIPDAQSLKEKRSVTKSIRTKLAQRYNVSISEIDHQDVWQRTKWAIVCVGNEKLPVEKELQRVLNFVDRSDRLEVTIANWEWL